MWRIELSVNQTYRSTQLWKHSRQNPYRKYKGHDLVYSLHQDLATSRHLDNARNRNGNGTQVYHQELDLQSLDLSIEKRNKAKIIDGLDHIIYCKSITEKNLGYMYVNSWKVKTERYVQDVLFFYIYICTSRTTLVRVVIYRYIFGKLSTINS